MKALFKKFHQKLKNQLDKHPTTKKVLSGIFWFLRNLMGETTNVIWRCIQNLLPLVLLSYLFYLCFAGSLDKVSAKVSGYYNLGLQ